MKYRIFRWDWKAQPDWAQITYFINELGGGKIYFHEVETGEDESAVLIANTELSLVEVGDLYKKLFYQT